MSKTHSDMFVDESSRLCAYTFRPKSIGRTAKPMLDIAWTPKLGESVYIGRGKEILVDSVTMGCDGIRYAFGMMLARV
ncbi:hypothetical protein [uncultured Bifidobacterium sp.]|uniref:hypothetical protein n=1 Tax=uncultured Bifidobacterium sp. TaxID=165187 RepID=UPI002599D1ED|nr:hypothetical protein [uncultured Bifidobacterium sp.]